MLAPRTIGLFAAVILVACSAANAQKIRGVVGYNLQQIESRVEKAEKLLKQGDAKSAGAYYKTAKTQWDSIHKDFKGKFDVNHPDIVAMRARLDAIAKKLKAGKPAQAEPKPAAASAGAASNAPPAAMLHVLKQIDASLDAAEQAARGKRLEAARSAFQQAEQQWTTQQKWNKGKYDPNHPTIVALAKKYERVKAAVTGLGAESAAATSNLPAVLGAIQESQKQLGAAYQEARGSFRDVSSLMSDFDSGREQNIDKLRVKVDELRMRAERVNSLLPNAMAAVRAFRQQYPDFSKLGKLVKNSWQARRSVEALEKFPGEWLADSKRLIDEALGYADENIKQFGTDKLGDLEGSDATRQSLAADAAEQWVLSYSAYLLDIVPSLLPELPKEAQATLPEFAQARSGFEQRAESMRGGIRKIAAVVAKTRKNVADARRRRLEGARFPKTTHGAGAAEKDILGAWARAIKDKQLVKLSVYRPYEVRTEARWRKDHWVVNTYRYIGANCLAKLASGQYMVYRMNFRNTRQADGSWSPLEHWSVGHAYEILEANIDK